MPDPISPRSLKLLQSYFDARCDIFLLAQRERLPVLDLIRWSQSPAVQTHIAALKRLTDDSIHLRTAQARLLSLDTLENIVKTTDDPHELRRAASVIYRGGATMPQPRPPRLDKPDPDSPPPRYIPREYQARFKSMTPLMQACWRPPYKPPRPTAHDSFAAAPTPAPLRTPALPNSATSFARIPALHEQNASGQSTKPPRSRPAPNAIPSSNGGAPRAKRRAREPCAPR